MIALACLLAWPCALLAEHDSNEVPSEDEALPLFFGASWTPDISKPGPDMGDFPNSAFTLPRGGVYVEQGPFTLQTAGDNLPAMYSWPFLLRFGLTDDVEFRMFASGLTSTLGADNTTGFAPLALDLKVHLWDDRMEYLRPAVALEVYLQTTWGSRVFNAGTEPSINLNLDFPFTENTNIEMSFGYSAVLDPLDVVAPGSGTPQRTNVDVNEFSYQWAWEQQLTEEFQFFIHGFYNGPILMQSGSGVMVGAGYFYQLSDRWMIFNSYNAGLSDGVPPFLTQFGVSVAL